MLIKSKTIAFVKDKSSKSSGFTPADYEINENKKNPSERKQKGAPDKTNPKEEEKNIRAESQAAYAAGYSEGMARGAEMEKRKLASPVSALEKILSDLTSLKKSIMAKIEPEILNLSILIAEKIIQQEIQSGREVYLSVMKEAIRTIVDREGMKIRMNPVDHDHMIEVNPGILNSFEGVKNPVFEKDDSLSQGDVVIETLFGEVDARLERQMEEIKSALSGKG
jgi:flagellar assembly protein FliH